MGKTTYWEWSVNDKKVKDEYSDETEFWVTVSNRESSTILVYCCANGDHEDHAIPVKIAVAILWVLAMIINVT